MNPYELQAAIKKTALVSTMLQILRDNDVYYCLEGGEPVEGVWCSIQLGAIEIDGRADTEREAIHQALDNLVHEVETSQSEADTAETERELTAQHRSDVAAGLRRG